MVKPDDNFRARDMFAVLDTLHDDDRHIVALVRPKPDDADVVQVAHPSHPDDWHDLPQGQIASYAPLQTSRSSFAAGRLVRLHLQDDAGDTLPAIFAENRTESAAMFDRLGDGGAKSVMTAGAQYCYYDPAGHYVCVPI